MSHPTEIKLRRKSGTLEVAFDDGQRFSLAAEYLRVHSPSAEVMGHGPGQYVLQSGKRNVGITDLEPVGNYGVLLHFDDGHNTGIYTWKTLYDLGSNFEHYWSEYLAALEKAGKSRDPGDMPSDAQGTWPPKPTKTPTS